MKRAAILGNGQLGAMLRQAGDQIGVGVDLIDVEHGTVPPAPIPISVEREHWPSNPLTTALQQQPGWLNGASYPHLVDRAEQKRLIDLLKLPTAKWCMPKAEDSQQSLHQQLGADIFLKSRRDGYDGRGQQRLREAQPSALADWAVAAIAEQAIPFDGEVSLVAARNRAGQIVYYRLTDNYHHHGILFASVNLPRKNEHLQLQAQRIMQTLMDHLNYVGVMAIEFFVVGEQLLINEIAPRVHNSGHWTQAAASISQFEMHLRAICDLPIVQPQQDLCAVMVNLIGLPYDENWLTHPAAQLHWYGKELRPGRKMGHLNFAHQIPQQLREFVSKLRLPDEYRVALEWVDSTLAKA